MLAVMALLVGAFIYNIRRNTRRQAAALLGEFQQAADQMLLTSVTKEIFRNGIIGIDDASGTVLYVFVRDGRYGYVNTTVSSRTQIELIKAGQKDASKHFVVREVRLSVKSAQAGEVLIPFYTEIEDGPMAMPERLAAAEKWRDILRSRASAHVPDAGYTALL